MKLFLLFALIFSCASKSTYKVTTKEEHFKAPRGGSVDVEIRVDEDEKNKIYPQSSISKIVLKSGAVIPPHSHSSDEYLHFTKGNGQMILDGKKIKIKNNMTIFIPKGMLHSYSNNTKLICRAIQVYTPAGPEQRFKKWVDEDL